MIKAFEEGETYRSAKYPQDCMVMGIGKETAQEYVLAVMWVDRASIESTGYGELTVPKSELGDWSLVEYGD